MTDPGTITCTPAWVRETMETLTLHFRMWFILTPPPPPMEGIRNSKGKGVQEEAIISKGVGLDADKVFFSGEFETRSIVFIDDLTLTVIHVNVIGS